MIYVYAITDCLQARPPLRGLESATLEVIDASGLRGIYSSHSNIETDLQPESLWTHERVVATVMRTGPVLPMRFGTTLPSATALRGRLEQEADAFHRLLRRVRGCVELAVRVGLPGPAEPRRVAADGADHLRIKLGDHRRREQAATRVLAPLAELACGGVTRPPCRPGAALRASYLVPGPRVAGFAAEVRRLQEGNPELELSCTGPWAPYSFVCARERG